MSEGSLSAYLKCTKVMSWILPMTLFKDSFLSIKLIYILIGIIYQVVQRQIGFALFGIWKIMNWWLE